MSLEFYATRLPTKKEHEALKAHIENKEYSEAQKLMPKVITIGVLGNNYKFCFYKNRFAYYQEWSTSILLFLSKCIITDSEKKEWELADFWNEIVEAKGHDNPNSYTTVGGVRFFKNESE